MKGGNISLWALATHLKEATSKFFHISFTHVYRELNKEVVQGKLHICETRKDPWTFFLNNSRLWTHDHFALLFLCFNIIVNINHSKEATLWVFSEINLCELLYKLKIPMTGTTVKEKECSWQMMMTLQKWIKRLMTWQKGQGSLDIKWMWG